VIYRRTLDGHGFGIGETRGAIELVQQIRTAPPRGVSQESHPFLMKG
jgi:hypothetical protein